MYLLSFQNLDQKRHGRGDRRTPFLPFPSPTSKPNRHKVTTLHSHVSINLPCSPLQSKPPHATSKEGAFAATKTISSLQQTHRVDSGEGAVAKPCTKSPYHTQKAHRNTQPDGRRQDPLKPSHLNPTPSTALPHVILLLSPFCPQNRTMAEINP